MANPSSDDLLNAPPPTGRLAQFGYAYKLTKRLDPKLTVVMLGWSLGAAAVVFVLFYLLVGGSVFGLVIAIILALLCGVLAATITLSRRVQRAQYKQIDGQPGAAYSVLDSDRRFKRNWQLTPMVQFNRQQDMVHRLIGTGGIILLAEGDPSRVKQLLTNERKAVSRYLGPDVAMEEVIVGPDVAAGQTPLTKLVTTLTRRGLRKRNLTSAQASEYSKRLEAIATKTGPMANMPKGPLPKGARTQRGGMR
ncbi:DUF4191 domain-containing protein [Actinospica sp.]|jgi:hypothetical protein|uniref:DUF4191 domain-containing protein n=1 Tax=Actinospica sp. TaxID=1872142 RepID=UPI002B6A5C11|nr:DUF4191 domain-containing protein [Actinospica sp.]HWG24546.1 DUF4191 domain-containing protein [Actinospica sp.]